MNKDDTDRSSREDSTPLTPLPDFERDTKEYQDACDHWYQETLRGVVCFKCGHFVGNWE